MKFKRYILAFIFAVMLSFFANAENPKIKVGLYFGETAIKDSLTVSFENGFQQGFVSDDGYFMPTMFYPDNQINVYPSGDGICIESSDGSVLYDGSALRSIAIMPLDSDNNETGAIPYSSIGSVKYPEILNFVNDGKAMNVINVVDSEIYFKGVLPSEVYPSWHEQALKAAAVATRTYTYNSMSGKHKAYGIDLCTTVCCQVYSGISRCQESTSKAVDDTAGQVLTYNGKLITAVYHAISGGITESAAGAWGGEPEKFPYLTVTKTPFERYNEIARGHWRHLLYDEDFDELIADSSYSEQISSPIVDISINDETPGYLNNVTLTDTRGNSIFLKTSSNVRSFFNTLSSNFTIAPVLAPSNDGKNSARVLTAEGEIEIASGDKYSYLTADGEMTATGLSRAYFIDGRGYGHGVGLSQYGAQYAAKAGYDYLEILMTYYPGTTLENYNDFLQNKKMSEEQHEN